VSRQPDERNGKLQRIEGENILFQKQYIVLEKNGADDGDDSIHFWMRSKKKV